MKGRDLRNGNHVATLRRLPFAESGRLCDSNGHIFNVFCFRRRWRCKCSHCESLGFLITNDGLRVDWAHQTCNLHVRRSTKRLREAEENREELVRICSSDSCSVLFCYKRNGMFVFGVRCLVNLSHKMHAHTLNCLPALCARALSVLRRGNRSTCTGKSVPSSP